jgi:hypothetical protein
VSVWQKSVMRRREKRGGVVGGGDYISIKCGFGCFWWRMKNELREEVGKCVF